MDIAARFRRQISSPFEADHTSLTLLGRETMIIDKESNPPLEAGTWYINVFDPVEYGTVPFSVYASFTEAAPEALLVIPQIEIPEPDYRAPCDRLSRFLAPMEPAVEHC